MGRKEKIDKQRDEFVKLGAKPSSKNKLSIIIIFVEFSLITGRRRRERGEMRNEEGVEGEKGLENMVRREIGGNEIEEKREIVDVL